MFQICTLKHSDSATAKRQEVGRGLRLCVKSEGERQDLEACGEALVHGVNKLTVVASESYAGFVSDLQKEIRADLYERPVKASIDYFTGKFIYEAGEARALNSAEATAVYNYIVRNNYIDDECSVTEAYRHAAETVNLEPLKAELEPLAEGIHKLVQAFFDPGILEEMTENGHGTKNEGNPLNENWKDFEDLWGRINRKYAYTVEFDRRELIEKSISAMPS